VSSASPSGARAARPGAVLPNAATQRPNGRLFGAGALLLLLTLLGGVLRAYRLGANSLWIDEFATLKIISRPFPEILRATAEINFCPPLYFWLVHGVVSIAGVSESSLRLVSAAAGTLTIPVAWLLARELTRSRTVAGICAALLALNPLHIWYSQEARPYALLVWFGCASLLFFLVAARTKAVGHWAAFVGCMTAVVLTHTIGPVVWMVALGWALLWPRRAGVLRPLFIATTTVALISAPFALTIMHAVTQANGNTHSPPRALTGLELPYTLLTYVGGYSFGPSMRDIQNLGALVAVRNHPLESALGAVTVCCLLLLVLFRPAPGRRYFVTLFVVPILAMLLASAGSGKAYQARYALAGLVGYCGLVAGALRLLPYHRRVAATAALLALAAWADVQWYVTPTYWKDDTRAAVAWLAGRLPPGSSVAVAPGYAVGVLSYYTDLEHARLHFVAADDPTGPTSPAALLLTRLHHVTDQASVRARFRQGAGPRVREDSVGGYHILSRTSGGSEPSGQ
jgi:mannosyltransferase